MFLIVGLGNPEGKYFKTYHNIGFVVADMIAEKLGVAFKKKGNQLVTNKSGVAIVLKPLTYMNLSGQAVVAVARKYKIAPENIIIVCDDLHIEKGNIRIAFGGSAGGHNGLKSISELLGTDKYFRVRVGIQPEKTPHSMADYVLSKIDGATQPLIDQAIDKAVVAAVEIASGVRGEIVMGKYNVKNNK